jgi:putative addiction module CopG family antidote
MEGPAVSTDQTRHVSLAAERNGFIRAQLASGQHANANEMVRAALRLLVRQAGQDGVSGQHSKGCKASPDA